MQLRFILTLAVAGVVTSSLPASAQSPRTHDGFYLRLGGGFGYASDSVEGSPPLGVADVEGTAQGSAGLFELGLGGVVGSGLVLGGGIWSAFIPEPVADDVEVAGQEIPEDVEFDNSAFHVLGPFLDAYVDPRGGFHLQVGLGVGLLSAGDGEINGVRVSEEHNAAGFGFMAGLGYEWWVGDAWGLGLLVRLTGGLISGEDDNDVEWDHTILVPGALFTATMN